MIRPSDIEPDIDLRDFLRGKIRVGLAGGGSQKVAVYGDWERPTNEIPSDFIVIFMNGDIEGIGRGNDFARGGIAIGLYSKLNDDGSVKKNRVKKLLAQFDDLVIAKTVGNYFFEYDTPRFITPTTPNQTTGFSVTTLNLKWHTINNFNKE